MLLLQQTNFQRVSDVFDTLDIMEGVSDEIEAVQSIFSEEVQHKVEGTSHRLSFSMNGQLIVTLVLDGEYCDHAP